MSLYHSKPVCSTWDAATIAAMRTDYADPASFTAMLTRLAARADGTGLPRSPHETAGTDPDRPVGH